MKRSNRVIKHSRVNSSTSKYIKYGFGGLTVLLLVLNILQINITSTKGYDIRELEDKKTSIQKEYKELQLAAYELQSMNRVAADMDSIEVVDARVINYIDTSATSFALDK